MQSSHEDTSLAYLALMRLNMKKRVKSRKRETERGREREKERERRRKKDKKRKNKQTAKKSDNKKGRIKLISNIKNRNIHLLHLFNQILENYYNI